MVNGRLVSTASASFSSRTRWLIRLLTWKTAEEQAALDRFAWQMLQGSQNVRRWFWTVGLVALALLVVGFFSQSP
jgi:hypothetical protein